MLKAVQIVLVIVKFCIYPRYREACFLMPKIVNFKAILPIVSFDSILLGIS
jgi:hypothetical protein